MKETEIQENLVGDTVPSATRKKEKGVSKTIYFAKISCKEFEQYGVFGSKKVSLASVLKDSFSVDNENYNNNLSVVSDVAFVLDFNEDMM